MESEKRDSCMDFLKGIVINLVIVGHSFSDVRNMVIDSALIVCILSVVLAFFVSAVCIAMAQIIGNSSWWRKVLFGK